MNIDRTGTAKRTEFVSIIPLVVLTLAQLGTSSDSSILSIATQALTLSLGATINDIQLANMMYVLVAGIFMVAGGMSGMMIGWRRNFRIGAFMAVAGEIIVAAAPSMTVLIWGGRALVGLGASFLIPSVLGLIPSLYTGKQRVFAFGCVAAATGISTLMPIPFGLLFEAVSFRLVFCFIAGYFALVLGLSCFLPKDAKREQRLSFDFGGLAFASVGIFCLLIGVSCASTWGLVQAMPAAPFSIFGFSPTLPLLTAGAVSLVLLAHYEQKKEQMGACVLLPQIFFKTPATRSALVAVAVPFFFSGAQSIIIIPYLQIATDASALETGGLLALAGVPMILLSIFIPKRWPAVDPRVLIRVGYLVSAAAAVIVALGFSPGGYNVALPVGMVLGGTGLGLVSSQASNAVARSVDERSAQQSGGLQGTTRDIAMALGIALFGAILFFSVSARFDALVVANAEIDDSVKTVLVQSEVAFASDAVFSQMIEGVTGFSENEEQIFATYSQARCEAARCALFSLGGILAICLASTRSIIRSSMDKQGDTSRKLEPHRQGS